MGKSFVFTSLYLDSGPGVFLIVTKCHYEEALFFRSVKTNKKRGWLSRRYFLGAAVEHWSWRGGFIWGNVRAMFSSRKWWVTEWEMKKTDYFWKNVLTLDEMISVNGYIPHSHLCGAFITLVWWLAAILPHVLVIHSVSFHLLMQSDTKTSDHVLIICWLPVNQPTELLVDQGDRVCVVAFTVQKKSWQLCKVDSLNYY